MVSDNIQQELRALFQKGKVCFPGDDLSDPELTAYRRDSAQQFTSGPGPVAFPQGVAELGLLVRFAAARGLALVPSGGRTGLSGGAVAGNGELAVSLLGMQAELAFDPYLPSLSFEAGATTRQVQEAAERRGLYFPVDFAAAGSATIGGNVATNAGGIHVIRYGMLRDWVLGLTVITGNGDILRLNGSLRKDNTGLDIRQLFIGSEGILGFVAEVIVRVTTPPGPTALFLLSLPDLGKALQFLKAALAKGLCVHAFEVLDQVSLSGVSRHLDLPRPFETATEYIGLLEVDGKVEGVSDFVMGQMEKGVALDALAGESSAARARFWRYREGISESLSMLHRVHKCDVSVPLPEMEGFVGAARAAVQELTPGSQLAVFGHLGDGNLHLNLLCPTGSPEAEFRQRASALDSRIYGLVEKAGGSVSAEHGIGLLKREHLHRSRSQVEIALMRSIKQVFDPAGIMNPGKVLPDGPKAP